MKEHAITYKDHLSVSEIDYLAKKANRLGRFQKELIRVFQEEDSEGKHIYYEILNGNHERESS